jgi:uncharacterized protein DUF1883
MRHQFKYASYDLHERQAGDRVVVNLRGAAHANVLLVDERNFWRYRGGLPFEHLGGVCHRSPVEFSVPRSGHWYVAMDLGGRPGRVRGAVKVIPRSGGESEAEHAV